MKPTTHFLKTTSVFMLAFFLALTTTVSAQSLSRERTKTTSSQTSAQTLFYLFSEADPAKFVVNEITDRQRSRKSLDAHIFTGNANQKFTIEDAGNGYVYVKSHSSGKVLGVPNKGDAYTTVVNMMTLTSSKGQKFKLVPKKKGFFKIESAMSPKMCITISGGKAEVGAGLKLETYSGTQFQHFRFVVAEPSEERSAINQLTKATLPRTLELNIFSGMYDNYVMELYEYEKTKKIALMINPFNVAKSQSFLFVRSTMGYSIIPKTNTKLAVTTSTSGVKLSAYNPNRVANQQFKPVYRGKGFYSLNAVSPTNNSIRATSSRGGTFATLKPYTGGKFQLFQLVLAASPFSKLNSRPETVPVISLTFKNETRKVIDIIYVSNTRSREYNYGTLEPGASMVKRSYKGRKWIAKDRSGTHYLEYTTTEKPETVIIKETQITETHDEPVEIKWLNEPPASTTHDHIVVTAEISHADNVAEIATVNNLVVDKKNMKEEEMHGKLYVEITAPLTLNENTIKLTVYTKKGEEIVAPLLAINRKKKMQSGVIKPNVYFLGIGISSYESENFQSLEFADDDVIALKNKFEALENSELYGNVKTKLLLDKEANLYNINEALGSFFSKMKETDYAIVMVSSHGEVVKDEFYIIPHDCDADPNTFSYRAISSHDIGKFLKNLEGPKILFLDACHSGAASLDIISKGSASVTQNRVNKMLSNIKKKGAKSYIFASSTGNQKSLQLREVGHGVFTHALMMGMEGKPYTLKTDGHSAHAGESIQLKPVRGVLMMSELQGFVMEAVMDMTGGSQHPSFRNVSEREDEEGADMPIYLIK